jgi:hypothetical protein
MSEKHIGFGICSCPQSREILPAQKDTIIKYPPM